MTCILGSFCNHEIDGNKNVKIAIRLIKTKQEQQQQQQKHLPYMWIKKLFLSTSFPILHGYVKFLDAIFYWVRSKNRTEILLSHSELGSWIQFQERPSSILIRWLSWYKRDLLYIKRKHIHLYNEYCWYLKQHRQWPSEPIYTTVCGPWSAQVQDALGPWLFRKW